MPVIRTQEQPMCKLCSHPRRDDIDSLLELRSLRKNDRNGLRVTANYCIDVFAEWGVKNPNITNLDGHWKKHCRRVEKGELEREKVAEAEALQLLADEFWPDRDSLPDFNRYPELIMRIEHLTKLIQLTKGELPRVTVDQAINAYTAKVKSLQGDKVDSLAVMMGAALTEAYGLQQDDEEPPGELLEINPEEVEEYEPDQDEE